MLRSMISKWYSVPVMLIIVMLVLCPKFPFVVASKIDLPTYWINLASDKDRANLMKKHLKHMNVTYFRRVNALTPRTSNILMLEHECHRFSLVDIAILCSHLSALHVAVNDQSPEAKRSRYALILEDDIRLQFQVDFEALIASAPKNFGVLQLMTSHFDQIVPLWKSYKNHRLLWSSRSADSAIWSAQAYIIDKEKYRPYLNAAVNRTEDGTFAFKIIQTFDNEKSDKLLHNAFKPTVLSVCIFADMFVYSVGRPAYILNAPIFNSAGCGMNSTSHQTHVAHHAKGYAFHQHSQREMMAGERVVLPDFADILNHHSDQPIDWTEISAKNPIRHWAQGSYKITGVQQ